MNDTAYMQQAFELALIAADKGEVPVGAIIVDQDNNIIGQGYNQTISLCDPTAHAEMMAIRQAALDIKNHRLTDTTLYVTLEPCSMCVGALIHARIKRLVFACRDFKTGARGSVANIAHGPASNHSIEIDEGVLETQCSQLLSQFFERKR